MRLVKSFTSTRKMPAWLLQRVFQQLLIGFRQIVSNVRHFGGALFQWHFGARWNNREPFGRGRDRGKPESSLLQAPR